ncbi:Zinc finger, C2H2-like protein [Corchorus capsularis]|uniref:Zinc finger, C2H2-like protein n=1 Tax=Corchorus capsularis TaxID=210143 RepID=A0A1R3G766_COCAP|nr:Zinc finger, C2H2-like protein [Corchorus capsularis]
MNAEENASRNDYDSLCNICGKAFKSFALVLKHQKEDHTKAETKYKCDLCKRGFPTRAARIEHRDYGH